LFLKAIAALLADRPVGTDDFAAGPIQLLLQAAGQVADDELLCRMRVCVLHVQEPEQQGDLLLSSGKNACPLAGRVREDKLLGMVQADYGAIFDDADSIIRAVTERAKELSGQQQ